MTATIIDYGQYYPNEITKWAPLVNYAKGNQVLLPNGYMGTALLDHQSANTPNYDNWFWSDGNEVSVGESTMRRADVVTGANLVSGQENFIFFTAKKTETINNVYTITTAAAGATPTLCRFGIYSVDSSGNLTLVASTPNDTTLFAAANTAYTKALSAPFNKVAGQRYAVGLLIVSAASMPSFLGQNSGGVSAGLLNATTPRIAGSLSGLSDLANSTTNAALGLLAQKEYVELRP
jgi:hypothetical protein